MQAAFKGRLKAKNQYRRHAHRLAESKIQTDGSLHPNKTRTYHDHPPSRKPILRLRARRAARQSVFPTGRGRQSRPDRAQRRGQIQPAENPRRRAEARRRPAHPAKRAENRVCAAGELFRRRGHRVRHRVRRAGQPARRAAALPRNRPRAGERAKRQPHQRIERTAKPNRSAKRLAVRCTGEPDHRRAGAARKRKNRQSVRRAEKARRAGAGVGAEARHPAAGRADQPFGY